jgi:SH3 domain protein
MNRFGTALLTLIFFSFSSAAFAETLYVTDRILLGVHQEASEVSPVIQSIPSGTAVTVLERGDKFIRIQLADGKQGWVSAGYLKPDKPATAQLDALNDQLKQSESNLKKSQDQIKKLKDEAAKRDHASQSLQNQIANDKSTIKELQTKLKQQAASAPTASKQAQEQIESQQEQIKKLQAQVKQLTDDKQKLVKETKSDSQTSMHDLQLQNQQLQARIEAAQANLKGEQVPSASQLASIRPSFPLWYWILLLALFVGGLAVGYGWFDYHHRKRHGGFRI